jgi:inner membrane protein
MSWSGILKVFIIGCLGLALSIGLVIVREIVSERSQRREQVYQDMARSTAASQILAGPFLVMPYERRTVVTAQDSKGEPAPKVEITLDAKVISPRHLLINGRLQADQRYRSLYEILLYGADLQLEGLFEFSKLDDLNAAPGSSVRWLQPYLLVLVQDNRGLTTIPVVSWSGKSLTVKPGQRGHNWGIEGGFHAELPSGIEAGGSFPFHMSLLLQGMQSFSWLPVGDETRVKLEANWPHPSFQGRALPRNHHITPQGFAAEWESTHFASNISQLITGSSKEGILQNQEIGVKLIQPVDIYLQTERSVKYGFLFIVLTFAVFLLFETLGRVSIHPVQYGLVGLALLLFYVLLLALSEHLSFVWAYGMASLASVSLLAFYISYVLHSRKHALGFAISLAILDAIIYGILMAEDYALLYGSCLLFSLLAAAMVITRRVDWNDVKLSR